MRHTFQKFMRNVGYKSELTDPRGGKDAEPKVEAPWLYLGYAHQTTNTERVVDHPLSSKNKSHPVKKNKQPVHETPEDLQTALHSIPLALATWEDITPLARNDWICWVISAKKPETRTKRIAAACEMLSKGKRRVCCFPGCPHR